MATKKTGNDDSQPHRNEEQEVKEKEKKKKSKNKKDKQGKKEEKKSHVEKSKKKKKKDSKNKKRKAPEPAENEDVADSPSLTTKAHKDDGPKLSSEEKKKKKKKQKVESDALKEKKAGKKNKTQDSALTGTGPSDAQEKVKEQESNSGKWNDWTASSFESDERKNRFLRLMGAKKTETCSANTKGKKGLFGGLTASGSTSSSSSAALPSAINNNVAKEINNNLESQFDDALWRRGARGGIGFDDSIKKQPHNAAPHPGNSSSSSAKRISTTARSMKFED